MSWGATKMDHNRASRVAPTVDYAVVADGRNNMYGGLVRDGETLFCCYRQDPYLWGGWRGKAMGRTSTDDGVTWSEAELIWNPTGSYCVQEIKAMILADGTYLLSGSHEHANSAFFLVASQAFVIRGRPGDWQKPQLVLGAEGSVYGCCSGAAIQLASGKILLPVYYDNLSGGGFTIANSRAGVISSTDNGATWSEPVEVGPTDEGTLLLNADGSIYFFVRRSEEGQTEKRYTSTDDGVTWSAGVDTSSSLVGYSVCQPDICRTNAGNLRRMYRLGGQSWHAYSVDDGVTWTDETIITGLMAGFISGFFQYGTLLPLGADGCEGIIACQRTETFDINAIAQSDISYFTLP